MWMEVHDRWKEFPDVEVCWVPCAQASGRGRDPPGCCSSSESVGLHGQQGRRNMDRPRGSEISAIHSPVCGGEWGVRS